MSEWIKAKASGGSGGDCVEMRRHEDAVEVRDSKDGGTGPTLSLDPSAFKAWVDAAKSGELDAL